MNTLLRLPEDLRQQMLSQAIAESPDECCGLLAGRAETVSLVIPLVNALHSPIEYAAEPQGLFDAMRRLREEHLELLAIYHSHPKSEAIPSRRDLREWHYGDTAMIIISLENETPVIRAWRIECESCFEITLMTGTP